MVIKINNLSPLLPWKWNYIKEVCLWVFFGKGYETVSQYVAEGDLELIAIFLFQTHRVLGIQT